jgi:energy-coupling factor transporter ATP-binding protein EcfA2
MVLIAAYIIIRFGLNLPITFNNYITILQSIMTGNIGFLSRPPSETKTTFSPIVFLQQSGVVLLTIFQSIVQPYWTYKHLKSIDTIIVNHGTELLRFRDRYEQLEALLDAHGFTFFRCPLPSISDAREATAVSVLESFYFKLALKYIGSLEVIMCLAHNKDIHSVQWVQSATPIFKAKNTFDFQVPISTRKEISVKFKENRNALLTGPNKGGKSTVLRSLATSALLAHTYGCAPGFITLTPFQKMLVCLKPDDLPGSKSRFEREIEFTAGTLKEEGSTLVLIDELYHSTNPPDALRSCQIYCGKLWPKPNIISVISTHLFELVDTADKDIQRLCCPATLDGNGDIRFEYILKAGVCKVSSVDELLRRNGML